MKSSIPTDDDVKSAYGLGQEGDVAIHTSSLNVYRRADSRGKDLT